MTSETITYDGRARGMRDGSTHTLTTYREALRQHLANDGWLYAADIVEYHRDDVRYMYDMGIEPDTAAHQLASAT